MPRISPLLGAGIAAILAFITTAGVGAPAASIRAATIVNGTRTVMVSLQLKPTGGKWTEVLNRKRLGIRQAFVYQLLPGACDHYDIRAMFDDGHIVNKAAQNLCKSPYLLTDF